MKRFQLITLVGLASPQHRRHCQNCWPCSTTKVGRVNRSDGKGSRSWNRSESLDFGKILMDIPLPADLVAHQFSSTAIGRKPTSRP